MEIGNLQNYGASYAVNPSNGAVTGGVPERVSVTASVPSNPNLQITENVSPAGEVGVPEGALARNDPLGRLVNSLFTLPAPPLPEAFVS